MTPHICQTQDVEKSARHRKVMRKTPLESFFVEV